MFPMLKEALAPVIPGLLISFFAIVVGTGLGMAFGVYEDPIKDHLLTDVKAHPQIHEQTPENLKKQTGDGWRYIQRAHFHAQGLGALGVGIIITLGLSWVSIPVKKWLALATGVGAFLYPFCWLIAGLRIASMGKEAAKASVDWLAYLSIPLFFGGLMLTLLILFLGWWFPREMPGFLKRFSM
jgi:hypothetical protein